MLKLLSALLRVHHLGERDFAVLQKLVVIFLDLMFTPLSAATVARECGQAFFSYTPLPTYTYTLHLLSQQIFSFVLKPGLHWLHYLQGLCSCHLSGARKERFIRFHLLSRWTSGLCIAFSGSKFFGGSINSLNRME